MEIYYTTVFPPYPRFPFLQFVIQSTMVWKYSMGMSRNEQFVSCKVRAIQSSVTKACTVPAPSPLGGRPFLQCTRTGCTHGEIFWQRERPYPIPFITVYCYKRSTLFLVVVVNLLPCLTYKLTSSQVGTGKSRAYLGFGTMHDFRCPLGVLESIPHGQGGTTMLSFILWMFRESHKIKEKKRKQALALVEAAAASPRHPTLSYLSGCWGCHWPLVRCSVPFWRLLPQEPWQHRRGRGAGRQSANTWQVRGPALQGEGPLSAQTRCLGTTLRLASTQQARAGRHTRPCSADCGDARDTAYAWAVSNSAPRSKAGLRIKPTCCSVFPFSRRFFTSSSFPLMSSLRSS